MKKYFLFLVFIFDIILLNAQFGVITLDNKTKVFPLNMWYTINGKNNKNQMYYRTDNKETADKVLQKVLSDIDVNIENFTKGDTYGDKHWESYLKNGYLCQVLYEPRENNYIITVWVFLIYNKH